MRAAMRSASCRVWLTRSARPMAASSPGSTHSSGMLGLSRVGQRDLGFLDLHRQRMAALLVDHAHQPIEQCRLAGLAPHLTELRHHARFVHAVDVRPGGEVVEIARRHLQPGALHGAAEAEQRHHHAEAELAVEIGAADAHAVIGENVGGAIGLAVTLRAETHDREVRGAAADIGDQGDLLDRTICRS